MTDAEKHACRRLLLSSDDSDDDDDFDKEDFHASVEHEKERKAKEVANVSDYIDCGFILGSTAATCEALWSKADEVLRKRRQGMSPRTLEMILFLKENRDLWDIRDVHRRIVAARLQIQNLELLKGLQKRRRTSRWQSPLD